MAINKILRSPDFVVDYDALCLQLESLYFLINQRDEGDVHLYRLRGLARLLEVMIEKRPFSEKGRRAA